MAVYFKGRWPEQPVPDGEPLWLFYEVIEPKDVVTRTIEIFAQGVSIRNSIKLAEREGLDARLPEDRSLVHGAFLEEARPWLEATTATEFERLWDSAGDKPWP
jgi:hypothetical protein